MDTHVHLDKTVHVMKLRMLTHDGYHREFGGEGNFDFILEEVAKIKAARQVSRRDIHRLKLGAQKTNHHLRYPF